MIVFNNLQKEMGGLYLITCCLIRSTFSFCVVKQYPQILIIELTPPPPIKLDKTGFLDKYLDKFYVFLDKFLLY